ncbi:MAG: hypothetical protein Q9227_008640 [Pyrenula ochraceoflavens]
MSRRASVFGSVSSAAGRARASISHHEDNDPDAAKQLAALGHKQELARNFSTLSMLGLAFAILNSWTALSASLSLALPSGGPTSVIWGLVTAGICNLCLAASLAEFLSAYPSAAGQYHWVAVISWKRWVPLLSWVTGWVNMSGWIALVATGGLLGSQLIVGIIGFMHANYDPQRWQQFLIYTGYTLAAFFINAFGTSALPLVTKGAFTWSIVGFTVICITLLACSSGDFQGGDFVYRKFINETGWPDGIAWLLGLLQGGLGLTGFDAVAHMIEEIPFPTIEGPKIMIEFPLICLLFATIGIMTTSSRMTYAFARDGGLPLSRYFAHVHPKLLLPLNSLILTTVLVEIFGLIFLGSSSAFNAITAASVVALGISYAIPPSINMLRGRRMLPASRPFKLPGPFGWVCNIIGVVYVIVTTVLFVFPPELPVNGSNMNYCVVVFAIILIIAATQWVIDGRKNYTGPNVDLDAMGNGEVMGMPVEDGVGEQGEGVFDKDLEKRN